jgi:hypothetical protein
MKLITLFKVEILRSKLKKKEKRVNIINKNAIFSKHYTNIHENKYSNGFNLPEQLSINK